MSTAQDRCKKPDLMLWLAISGESWREESHTCCQGTRLWTMTPMLVLQWRRNCLRSCRSSQPILGNAKLLDHISGDSDQVSSIPSKACRSQRSTRYWMTYAECACWFLIQSISMKSLHIQGIKRIRKAPASILFPLQQPVAVTSAHIVNDRSLVTDTCACRHMTFDIGKVSIVYTLKLWCMYMDPASLWDQWCKRGPAAKMEAVTGFSADYTWKKPL